MQILHCRKRNFSPCIHIHVTWGKIFSLALNPVPLHSGLPPQLAPPSSGSASAAAGYYGHHAPPPPPSSSSSGDPNSPVNKYHGLSIAAAATAAHENGHGGGGGGGHAAANHLTAAHAAHDGFSDFSHFVDVHGHAHHAAAAAAAHAHHAVGHHPGPGRSPYSVYGASPPTSMPPAHISRPLTVLRPNGERERHYPPNCMLTREQIGSDFSHSYSRLHRRPPICEICAARDPPSEESVAPQSNETKRAICLISTLPHNISISLSLSLSLRSERASGDRTVRPWSLIALFLHSIFDAITPLNPFVTADPDASPPPPPSSVAATSSSAQTPTTAAAASASSPQSGSLQQLEAAAGGCNESSGRQLSPSSETGQDLSAPRQQSEVRARKQLIVLIS